MARLTARASPDGMTQPKLTLVLGGTGKTGHRVATRLRARGQPIRISSRSGEPPFDWGREIRYVRVSLEQYASVLAQYGFPPEVGAFLTKLFAELLDGRNSHLTDGVGRSLGREPRDFADYARHTATTGVWAT